MKECINCDWKGEIETEFEPEERKNYATYCPCCGRQTLQGDGEPV